MSAALSSAALSSGGFRAARVAEAPRGTSLDALVEGVARFVRACLSLHDAAFSDPGRVATYLSDAVYEAESRGERVGIMGDPARYAEVEAGRLGTAFDATGTGYVTQATVSVYLYWGCAGGRPTAEDAERFRRLLSADDPTGPPGLVTAFSKRSGVGYVACPDGQGGTFAADVETVAVVENRRYDAAADGDGPEWRHEAHIELTLSD